MTDQQAPPAIDATEAERRMTTEDPAPLLIDVREPWEFEGVRAPGAVLMPMSTFTDHVSELPADRPLMIVCHSGNRSAAVAGYLRRAGRTDVVNVAGGMEAWEGAGLRVRRGRPGPDEGALPR